MVIENFGGISLMGGKGTRFFPITAYMPKEFLPIEYFEHKEFYNKKNVGTEIIVCQLYQMDKLGIKEKIVVINPEKELDYKIKLKKRWEELNNSLKNEKVKKVSEIVNNVYLVIQKKAKGDADAIYLALKNSKSRNFLVYYGDVIYNSSFYLEDFKRGMEEFLKNNYDVLFYAKFIQENPERYGVFKVRENKVEKIVEKPKENLEELIYYSNGKKGFLINTGVFLIKKESLFPLLEKEIKENEKKNNEVIMAKVVDKYLDNLNVGLRVLSENNKLEDYGTFADYIKLIYSNIKKTL